MHSFNPTDKGVGEYIYSLLQLLSSCLADMVVAGAHAPRPEYKIFLSANYDNLVLSVPATLNDPSNAMSLEYNYHGRVLSINLDKIQQVFVVSLLEKERPDARSINEEVLTHLMIIQQLLIAVTKDRLITMNTKDVDHV